MRLVLQDKNMVSCLRLAFSMFLFDPMNSANYFGSSNCEHERGDWGFGVFKLQLRSFTFLQLS